MAVRSLCLVAAVGALLAGCSADGAPSSDPTPTRETMGASRGDALVLEFDDVVADFGSLVSTVENRGAAALDVSVATSRDGRIRLGRGVDGGGAAVLPAFDDATAPAAALVAVPATGSDPLEPRGADFAFGAWFAINRVSEGSDRDNGNNLLQRGLFADSAQYKIQVDGGVPSCRIAGRDGAVVVSFDEPVPAERWFAIECARSGTEVSLRLTDLEGDGETETATVEQATGILAFADGVPLSVGAKVTTDGMIPEGSTDQFNGAIDGAFYRAPP